MMISKNSYDKKNILIIGDSYDYSSMGKNIPG
jgi:hypothetical protein